MSFNYDPRIEIPIEFGRSGQVAEDYYIQGYVVSELCLTEKSLSNITVHARYTPPVSNDGSVSLCASYKDFKLSDLK